MASSNKTQEQWEQENQDLRAQLAEAQETLRAIREGDIDALVIAGPDGDRVFTLQGADQAYRTFVEQMQEGAVTIDRSGGIRYCNQRFAEMLDVPLEQVVGSTFRDHVAKADRKRFGELLHQAQGDSARGELTLCAGRDRHLPAYLAFNAIVLNGVPSLCLVVTDLTDQKRAETILASERYVRSILNQARDAILVCDADQRLTFANAAARRAAGLDPADTTLDLSIQTWGQRFEPDGRPVAPEDLSIARALRGEPVVGREMHLVRRDGSSYDILISAGPLRDADNRVIGAVATFSDITIRKQAEEALQRTNEELAVIQEELAAQNAELLRTKESLQAFNESLEQRVAARTAEAEHRAAQLQALAGQLTQVEQRERRRLATVLHDHLQQLLVGAKFNLRVLQGDLPEGPLREQLRAIDELLDESLASSRSLTVELSPPILSHGNLVAALHWLSRQIAEKNSLQVQVQADERANPTSDEVRVLLFQAVRELLLNIIKHAHVGQATVEMAHARHDTVRITVADSGRGFDPARVVGDHSSSGFGLFSIRERIELMGGRMEVESAPGRGTRIHLTAPLQLTAPQQVPGGTAEASPPVPAGAREPEAVASTTSDRIRVLLADDHVVVRTGLARLLQLQPDMEVIGQAADGRQAVDMALQVRPDVVVMDVTMPKLDGLAATRLLRYQAPETKVIGLSMHTTEDMAEAMKRAGATAYLVKSAPPETLIAAIRRARTAAPPVSTR
jgi:PAS domain S-box-containing protein